MADSAQFMIQEAGIQLQTTVTSTEATSFNHTTFDDVEQALHAIEDEQAKRMSLRNLARIQPFLSWVRDYSSVLDTFCQGFSPMAWVWVHRIYLRDFHVLIQMLTCLQGPVKLLVQVRLAHPIDRLQNSLRVI
jgi:hypothetical protein